MKAELAPFFMDPEMFPCISNIFPIYALQLPQNLLVRLPHQRQPAGVLEQTKQEPRLDYYMQMQMMY